MITIDVLSNFLRISVPTEMKSQAPIVLADIWRDEFNNGATFRVELTETVKRFIEKAKLNFSILVYQ